MEGKKEEHSKHPVGSSKAGRKGSEPYFPQEIIDDHILQYLPPKALVRFKCVNKHSKSLIKTLLSDPKFVSKHTQNALNNFLSPPSLIFGSFDFQFTNPLLTFKEKLSVVTITTADDLRRSTAVAGDLPPVFDGFASYFKILHCNGVLCLVGSAWNILLWNPELGEVKLTRPDPYRLGGSGWGVPIVGFGHDSAADDYKVVITAADYGDEPVRALVYSLCSDEWREFEMPIRIQIRSSQIGDLYHDGVFYWLIRSSSGLGIVTFDIREEVFRAAADLPNEIRFSRRSFKIVLWNGGVALVSYPGERVMPAKTVEIWATDPLCGGGRWRRFHTIGPFARLLSPVVFWKGGELLMECVGGGLVSYNLNDKKIRGVDVVPGGEQLSYFACVYVPSLVSVLKYSASKLVSGSSTF